MRRSELALAIVSIAVLALGCASSPEPSAPVEPVHPATLAGTSWTVVSVNGRAPVAGFEPSVTFGPANVSGSDGCNQFGGTYRYEGASGRLVVERAVAITEMACARRDLASQGAFLQALVAATDASLEAPGRLVLNGARGPLMLVIGR
jgi:heat shock protein HslJ